MPRTTFIPVNFGSINSDIVPATDNVFDFGSLDNRYRSAHLALDLTLGRDLTVGGDLTVDGTTTTINSTTLTVDDKNIKLAVTASPTDLLADGGGIILKGTTDITMLFDEPSNSWVFNRAIRTGNLELNGNTISSTNLNGDVLFSTNALERMRIDGAGRVMIGATSAAANLHIQENTAGTRANLTIRHADGTNANSGADLQLVTIDSTGGDPSIIFSISNVADWSMGVDNSDGDKFKIGAISVLGVDDKLTIERGGKVIVEDQIQIRGGAPGVGKVLTGTDALGNSTWQAASGGGWVDDGTVVSLADPTDTVIIGSATFTSVFAGPAPSNADHLTIFSSDAVLGIDKYPDLLLHNDDQATGNSSSIGFSSKNTTNSNVMYAAISGISGARNAAFFPGELAFYTRANNSSVLTERMRIDENGNRGLGTSNPHSTDHVEGSVARSITTKTAAYIVTANDHTILVDASSAAIPITLPTTSGITGRSYNIKKIDSSINVVTIDASGAQAIDGNLTQTLNDQNESVTIQTDGSNWFIV